MRMLRVLLVATLMTTTACGGSSRRDLAEIVKREHDRVEVGTIPAAILYGEQYSRYYLREGLGVRSRRTAINLGLLAANTFVTAAAGLEAHPDTIFAGALAAATIHNLDPIVNPGGAGAWQAAYATNLCVLQVARAANTDQLVRDFDTLRRFIAGAPADQSALENAREALSRYRGGALTLQAAMDRAFSLYVRQTTPELAEVSSAAEQLIRDRTSSSSGDGGNPVTAEELDTETPAAIARLTEAIAAVDANTPKCFPAAEEGAGS